MGQEDQRSEHAFLKDVASMRLILILMLSLLGPVLALAHPGKTDYQDAHRCLKNCVEWDLDYGEYHLHDEKRNSIRIGSGKISAKVRMPQVETVTDQKPLPLPAAPEQAARTDSSHHDIVQTPEPGRVTPVVEGGMFPLRDMLLIIIAAILVMVLFILRKRKVAG